MGTSEIATNPEMLHRKPFIIMNDVMSHMTQWAEEKQFILPRATFLNEWRESNTAFFKKYCPDVVAISETQISGYLLNMTEEKIRQGEILPIFIDRIYTREHKISKLLRLDVGRAVDSAGNKLGYFPRPGSPPLDEQYTRLKLELEKMGNSGNVFLVDDAVISGGTPIYIIDELRKHGINVTEMFVGVATKNGIEKLKNVGVELHANVILDSFVDVICEGDLIPGIPGAGLIVKNRDSQKISRTPYLYPHMTEQLERELVAISSKENMISFLMHFYSQSILLYTWIEYSSKKPVFVKDLGSSQEKVFNSFDSDRRIIDMLQRNLDDYIGFYEHEGRI